MTQRPKELTNKQTKHAHTILPPHCEQLQHSEDSETLSACWVILVFP